MKNAIKIVAVLIPIFIIACKDDDPVPPQPKTENQAPGAFTLLEIANEETNVDLQPRFSWNTSTDPDGDMVLYDLFLYKDGTDVRPEDRIATDLNTTLFKPENNISLITDYSWYVVAKDDKGNETPSNIFTFTTRNLNNPKAASNDAAQFSPRLLHTVTLFKDKLWLIGGADNIGIKSDIHNSTNGIDWINENNAEIQLPLRGHSTIVFKDTLWVFGGRNKKEIDSRKNLMLASLDGNNFNEDYTAPWKERELHTSAVFQDKVWILGGIDNENKLLNDVWSTSDVRTWDLNSQEVANWHGRFGHSSVVFDDKLWVIGGFDGSNYLNEVWYTDGTTLSNGDLRWEFVPQENAFPGRTSHQTVVYDNKIWLVGGNKALGKALNDVWYSEDGANWIPLTQDANFTGRIRPVITVLNDQLLMIGGFDGSTYFNDVWTFE